MGTASSPPRSESPATVPYHSRANAHFWPSCLCAPVVSWFSLLTFKSVHQFHKFRPEGKENAFLLLPRDLSWQPSPLRRFPSTTHPQVASCSPWFVSCCSRDTVKTFPITCLPSLKPHGHTRPPTSPLTQCQSPPPTVRPPQEEIPGAPWSLNLNNDVLHCSSSFDTPGYLYVTCWELNLAILYNCVLPGDIPSTLSTA